MAVRLEGKVALITGANRGIGKGCALELAREGDIGVNYRRHRDEAKSVAEQVRGLGRRAIVMQGDVAVRASNEEMIHRAVAELGRLDIFVANAALSVRKPFLELTEEDMAATLGVTLWGVFHGCQLAARQMVAQGHGGSIIVISSVHAAFAYQNSLPYNTAKAGINHMARTAAGELAPHNIRVNIVEPGWTDTPGERAFATEEELRAGGAALPLGRLATTEDLGRCVAFLASDDAAYITGATLRVDGGFVLPRPGM
jgi:glucose 1-dehydrogenase